MVKKIQVFIKNMIKYSTPQGINLLEMKFKNFVKYGADDILKVVKHNVDSFVNQSDPELEHVINHAEKPLDGTMSDAEKYAEKFAPHLETALHNVITDAGMSLGRTIVEASESNQSF